MAYSPKPSNFDFMKLFESSVPEDDGDGDLLSPISPMPNLNWYDIERKKYIRVNVNLKKDLYFQEKQKELHQFEIFAKLGKIDLREFEFYRSKIRDLKDWILLSFIPKDFHFANIRSMKMIIDTKYDKIYFFNSYFHRFHFSFYKNVIFNEIVKGKDRKAKSKYYDPEDPMDLAFFNNTQYKRGDRRFVLFTITHYVDMDLFCCELWPDDTLEKDKVEKYINLVQANVFFKLYFRPVSNTHRKNTPSSIPVKTDLFSSVKYQPLTKGTAYGKLRFFSSKQSEQQEFEFDESEIVFCEGIPLDLTPIAALITNSIQTPLSHCALLTSNRKTPNCALIGKFNDTGLRKFENQWVKVVIAEKEYIIVGSTQKVYEEWKKLVSLKKSRITLSKTSDFSGLIVFGHAYDFSVKEVKNMIGGKATTLMRINYLKQFPEITRLPGFSIPFHYFNKYVQEKLTKKNLLVTAENILKNPFDDFELIEKIYKMIKMKFGEECGKAIFRSSTNVEDIKNFNGAGLYDSLSCSISDENYKNEISSVITKVYASLYSKRGVAERKYFNIDEQNVSMSILVMPYVKSELNGVALSCNPSGKNYPTFFVNVQKGVLVTDSKGGTLPEQWLIYDAGSYQMISRSSLAKKEDEVFLENDKVLLTLHSLIKRLDSVFRREMGFVDIEFLVNGTEVILLQCRPYVGDCGQYWQDT